MRIPEETIETVRSKTDIVDLIGEYIQLTKRGKNWFGLCPFHGESTPSFSVSEEKQLFHCFGCGASGNAITFVMDIENHTFVEAVSRLAERIGLQVDIAQPVDRHMKAKNVEHQKMIEAHQLAANFYNYLLLHTVEGEKALHYLEKRGFSREHIEHYEIGWSIEDPTSLTNLLQRKNFQLSEMERAGLCMMKKDGTGYFDRFRGRIMFPLHDDNGNIVAFSGRVLSTDRDEPKYLNSPESPIFAKNKLLYNFHRARLNVRKKGKVILFEGFMDTIAAERAGILNSVAVMGTSLSETHLLKLKRLTDELIICCDGDEAGWEAARRFALLARQHQLNVRIAVLPNDMDPDEFIQANGGEEFKEKVLDQPFTYFSFIMKYAKRGKNLLHENDVLQYIHEVVEELAQSQSPVERDLLVKQLASETGVSVDAIQEQLIKKIGQRAKEVKRNEMIDRSEPSIMVVPERKSTNVDKAERILLNHLLHDGALFDRLREHYDALFIHDVYNAIFVRLAAFYEQYGTPDFHRFAESIDDRTLRKIVMEAAMLDREPEFAEQEISDCLQCIKEFRIRQQIDQLLQRSKEAEKEKNYSVALELAREIIQLRKSLSAL